MDYKLKRCPMCGAEEVSLILGCGGPASMNRVRCSVCELCTAWDESEKVVIEEWNRRAIEDELEAEMEEFIAELRKLRQALYDVTGAWHDEPVEHMSNAQLIESAEEYRKLKAGTISIRVPAEDDISANMLDAIDHLATILGEEVAEAEKASDLCWNCQSRAIDQETGICSNCGVIEGGDVIL
jgi:Lar family restriction alleviation protein